MSEYGSGTAIFQTEKIQKHPNKIHTSLIWERGWHVLESFCCKKSPNQEIGLRGFGNRGHLKVLNDTKLVLNGA